MRLRRESGYVLVLVTAVIVGIMMFGLAMVQLRSSHGTEVAKDINHLKALNLAEAGMDRALWKLKSSLTWHEGWTGQTLGDGTYSVTFALIGPVTPNGPNTYTVRSVGTAGSVGSVGLVAKRVSATVVAEQTQDPWPSALDYALYWANKPPSATPLTMQNNSSITGNIFGFGNFVVDNNASVDGLVYSTGTVTGGGSYTQGVLPEPPPDPPVFDHTYYNTEIATAAAVGSPNWSPPKDYHLNGATKYVNGSVSLTGKYIIYGPGTIVSTGNMTFGNNAKAYDSVNLISGGWIYLNNNNVVQADPPNVIYGRTGVDVSNLTSIVKSYIFSPGTVAIYNNDVIEGLIWAGTARVENNSSVLGAIFGEQYYGSAIANNFELIYDDSLLGGIKPPGIPPDPPVTTVTIVGGSWSEEAVSGM